MPVPTPLSTPASMPISMRISMPLCHGIPGVRGRLSGAALAGALALLALCGPVRADVFVSSEKDHAILQLDADGKVLRSIPVCQRPRHMAWINKQQILTACGDSNQLGLVDLQAGKLMDSMPTAEGPEIFALSPDARTVYVSVEDDSLLAAYDLASKKPLFTVKTGAEPEGVLATADGKWVFVTSEVANTVYKVDVATRKIAGQARTGMRPRRFAITPDASELWVSNELGASVSIIDSASMRVKQTLVFQVAGMRAADITPVGMVMAGDGKTLWVALGRANRVAEVDVATRSVRGMTLVGKRAWGLALNADGSRLYVANGMSDDMSIIDTASRRALKTVPVGRAPHSILVN